MTAVCKHPCMEDRNGKLGDCKGSTGCSKHDVLTVFDVVSGDRNEDGRMFGKVRSDCTCYRKRSEKWQDVDRDFVKDLTRRS